MNLQDIFIVGLKKNPYAIAICDTFCSMTYQELENLINRFEIELNSLGVSFGDRVGIYLEKSRYVVAAMQAILRLGAAYVPLSISNGQEYTKYIINDCQLKLLITEKNLLNKMNSIEIPVLLLDDELEKKFHGELTYTEFKTPAQFNSNNLAYILYTSGSTGNPKGVAISHGNAVAFIQWAVNEVSPSPDDRFANHAPFNFDLSIFDIYVSFYVGASVYLVPHNISYFPDRLFQFIKKYQITIWYSVPSVLLLMMQENEFLQEKEIKLKTIIFAGEVFPINFFKKLYRAHPKIKYYNFYGPTETNVCMYFSCNEMKEDLESIPIGFPACGNTFLIKSDEQNPNIGELLISGPTVMLGYWGKNLQEDKYYATGDLVRQLSDGSLEYISRKDNMVKLRGFRIELEQIESILLKHELIQQAVVCVHGCGLDAQLHAFLIAENEKKPSLVELKAHCARHLPNYMVIDVVYYVNEFPRNQNGKLARNILIHDRGI